MRFTDQDLHIETFENKLLISAAKEANGYWYYETKVTRTAGSDQIRLDLYEKYRKPKSKMLKELQRRGVELVVHKDPKMQS